MDKQTNKKRKEVRRAILLVVGVALLLLSIPLFRDGKTGAAFFAFATAFIAIASVVGELD